MAFRSVTFSDEERARLAKVCQVLGIKFHEFVHDATMQACDEMEGYAREALAIREHYERH